jgi:hypothetical protein
MDITLSKVESVAFIQHKPDSFNKAYNTIIIYTESGKVTLDLFGEKTLVFQLGEDD